MGRTREAPTANFYYMVANSRLPGHGGLQKSCYQGLYDVEVQSVAV